MGNDTYNGSVQEPERKPRCCGQDAKWICHSVNLHYFYCEVCKKEVVDKPYQANGLQHDFWGNLSSSSDLSIQVPLVPFTPCASKYAVGDWVVWRNHIQHIVSKVMEVISPSVYRIKYDDPVFGTFTRVVNESELAPWCPVVQKP